MGLAINLPRLAFGSGSLAALPGELELLGASRPLLISDRGIERAGLLEPLSDISARYLDIPENPTAVGVDRAAAAYRAQECDAIVAVGGGSVIDSAKIVAALAGLPGSAAADVVGRPAAIGLVAPLVAVPTTVGTGSESSPVAAVHLAPGGPGIGTRHPRLVPSVAICDPDLARSLPTRLIAATAIDALSHCIEGFFAEPANPLIDALALDGARRVMADVEAALSQEGDEARASLMAAAFAGGAAIHKGLGPAHAVALVCGDQHVHHGTLVGVALPAAVRLVAQHVPGKTGRLLAAIGAAPDADLGHLLGDLIAQLGLPSTLREAGYQVGDAASLLDDMVASHFNRTSPHAPNREEYARLFQEIAG